MPLLDTCISSVYEPGNIPADSGATPTTPGVVPDPSGSQLLLLDIPLVRRSDEIGNESGDLLRHYMAVASQQALASTQKYGGDYHMFFETLPPDGIYVKRATRVYGAPYGTLVGAPPAVASPYMTDYSASFTIEAVAGQPFSEIPELHTVTQMYDEESLFMLGAEGRRVLGAFQTRAELSGTGQHVFGGGMLLGLYGTEIFIDQLVAGDPFVFLGLRNALVEDEQDDDHDPVFRDRFARNALGTDLTYRVTHINGNPELAVDAQFTVHAQASKPPASVNLRAVTSVSPAGLDLSWDQRTRFPWPQMSPPTWDREESEASIEFEVEILDGATVVRTLSAIPSPTVLYEEDDIIADFGSVPATLTYRVYKMSENVGRGFPAQATVVVE